MGYKIKINSVKYGKLTYNKYVVFNITLLIPNSVITYYECIKRMSLVEVPRLSSLTVVSDSLTHSAPINPNQKEIKNK